MALTSAHAILAVGPHPAGSHGLGVAVLIVAIVVLALAAVAVASPRLRPVVLRVAAWVFCVVVGAYLVGRAIVEFFIINYSDPASYAQSWGGPSLAGVFAVHSGPGVAVLIGVSVWLVHRWRKRPRQVTSTRSPDRRDERVGR
jgi:predicted tellurium resistance membrane protein TerC